MAWLTAKGYGKNIKDQTMDNPQPSPFWDAVHRLNGDGLKKYLF